jgi:hypothetical protein
MLSPKIATPRTELREAATPVIALGPYAQPSWLNPLTVPVTVTSEPT